MKPHSLFPPLALLAAALSGCANGGNFSTVNPAASTPSTPTTPSTPPATAPLVQPLAISSPALVAGQIGVAYTAQLNASGGVAPYRWSLASGSLPAGLAIDATSGALSGTPAAAGTYSLQIALADSAAPRDTASQSVSLTVAALPAATAARLLEQSSFGATADSIAHIQGIGIPAYLTEQFSAAPSLLPSLGPGLASDPPPDPSCQDYNHCDGANWWKLILSAPDQLRQRIAFTLSEIFVLSANGVDARALPLYWNTLSADAFTNYRTVMGDVTLNSGMGVYLDMTGDTSLGGTPPNENFAREMMQLFTVGTVRLNDDGTTVLDANGNPVPVYTEAQVQSFARAYTGWTWALPSGINSGTFNIDVNYSASLVAAEPFHDHAVKTLLNGTTLPAGQNAASDMQGALDNLFADPNLPPFVSLKLIQNLVTGQPSPAYLTRVSAVFRDNGSGVRGDLQAVVRAILTDPEARAGDSAPSTVAGHLKQPLLWQAGALRGLGVQSSTPAAYMGLDQLSDRLGEHILNSPTVFGFYAPGSLVPGTAIVSPEFGMDTTALASARLGAADTLINLGANGFVTDLSAQGALCAAMTKDPAAAVESLNGTLLHGAMPDGMRSIILKTIAQTADPDAKLRLAVYLILTSNEFSTFT